MPHNPNDPITVEGGSVNVSIPKAGVAPNSNATHHKFKGHTDHDRITRILITNSKGVTEFEADQSQGVDKWTVQIFFDHP